MERKWMDKIKEYDRDMVDTITAQLETIAAKEQINILYACESGSRAWGFPSPDSDYDVRFIYLRPLEWYLSILHRRGFANDDRPDTLDLPIDSLLDINGWDLRKALKLFKGSNSAIYEWIQSPIVYRSDGNLPAKILNLAHSHYAGRAGIHHYLNMTTNCDREHLQADTVKLKKYFYAIRPILAAKWIIEHRTFPPMVLDKLLPLISDRLDILAEIVGIASPKENRLLTIKATASEAATIPASPILNDFIRSEIDSCEAAVKLIPKHETDTLALDRLFKQYAIASG